MRAKGFKCVQTVRGLISQDDVSKLGETGRFYFRVGEVHDGRYAVVTIKPDPWANMLALVVQWYEQQEDVSSPLSPRPIVNSTLRGDR
jgi:hypothetical protein